MNELSRSQLMKFLNYDPLTGEFIWVISRSPSIKPGDVAGWLDKSTGYIRICLFGKFYRAHRLAYFYMTGAWPLQQIDHRDRIKTNNKWSNLRPATHLENQQNRGMKSNNTSGVAGVGWVKNTKKWTASIRVNYKYYFLGNFVDWFEAVCARKSAEHKLRGSVESRHARKSSTN